MVRLKDRFQLQAGEALPQFQFHYGTIKSSFIRASRAYLSIFQFHYGTIKRIRAAWEANGLVYFNSTMVRLKASNAALQVE